jgi:CRISPR/Cas system-associated exonuclease Cas4 (RecB family)
MMPSRLLFHCPDRQLPARLLSLYRDEAPEAGDRRRSWLRIVPPSPPAIPDALSVTDFKSYLTCPFRFYLKRILCMEAADDLAVEMDGATFGDICHDVFNAFAKDAERRSWSDDRIIGAWFEKTMEHLIGARFGRELPVQLIIQVESLRQRLAAAARMQAESVKEGWQILDHEQKFVRELDGMILKGRIDRIDRHRDGRIRVLDYKTQGTAVSPEDAHFRSMRAGDPDWSAAGGKQAWADLQLPLYRFLLEEKYGAAVQCGYFILPDAVSETGIRLFDAMTDEAYEKALLCAKAVVQAIRAARFWPPRDAAVDYDYQALLFDAPVLSVDPAELIKHGPDAEKAGS